MYLEFYNKNIFGGKLFTQPNISENGVTEENYHFVGDWVPMSPRHLSMLYILYNNSIHLRGIDLIRYLRIYERAVCQRLTPVYAKNVNSIKNVLERLLHLLNQVTQKEAGLHKDGCFYTQYETNMTN